MAHYAILVSVNRYPGLRNLNGPENDLEDFRDWLRSPEGGNVPPANLRIVRSSDFPPCQSIYDESPVESHFKQALVSIMFDANQRLIERPGERLYLFFAGHGFAGRRLSEAALYTAQASRLDPDHIACKRYAERVVNCGVFDEVVLVMDCCRDVDLSDAIREPNFRIPDAGGHGRVQTRFFEAYAAMRGEQARERHFDGTGKVRGVFTTAFVDALRNAPPDDTGAVTTTIVKNYILNRWPALFNGAPPQTPDIHTPGNGDFVLVRRPVAAPVRVRFRYAPPVPPGMTLVVEQSSRVQALRVTIEADETEVDLPDGLYRASIEGLDRSALFDAAGSAMMVML